MIVEPVSLNGEFVLLEPLSEDNIPALCEVGLEPSLWKLSPSKMDGRDAMAAYVQAALSDRQKGFALPFVTVEKKSNKIIGSTRFGNIDVPNRKVEIGWTWIAPAWQRTYVNTEAKLLMLTYAFEVWKCVRVELKTDALNEKSRNAIARIGAKQEGIHRNHMITDSGRFRDSVFFSIIESEWNTVKENLNLMLQR